MKLIRIGYWLGDRAPDWPDAKNFVDPTWDIQEREMVVDYLRGGMVIIAQLGFSTCRFCGCLNGSLERTDGVYIWPEGLPHYLEHHSVRLPNEFLRHVNAMIDKFEDVEIDDHWWRSQNSLGQ